MSERSDGAPDRIWLQLHGDGGPDDGPVDCTSGDVSWCWEPIFDQDVEYIRAGLAAERERELREMLRMCRPIVAARLHKDGAIPEILRDVDTLLTAHEQEKDDG